MLRELVQGDWKLDRAGLLAVTMAVAPPVAAQPATSGASATCAAAVAAAVSSNTTKATDHVCYAPPPPPLSSTDSCDHSTSSSSQQPAQNAPAAAATQQLLDVVETMWGNLQIHASKIPASLCRVLAHIRAHTVSAMGQECLGRQAVGTFLVLRLICPALAMPHLFRLVAMPLPLAAGSSSGSGSTSGSGFASVSGSGSHRDEVQGILKIIAKVFLLLALPTPPARGGLRGSASGSGGHGNAAVLNICQPFLNAERDAYRALIDRVSGPHWQRNSADADRHNLPDRTSSGHEGEVSSRGNEAASSTPNSTPKPPSPPPPLATFAPMTARISPDSDVCYRQDRVALAVLAEKMGGPFPHGASPAGHGSCTTTASSRSTLSNSKSCHSSAPEWEQFVAACRAVRVRAREIERECRTPPLLQDSGSLGLEGFCGLAIGPSSPSPDGPQCPASSPDAHEHESARTRPAATAAGTDDGQQQNHWQQRYDGPRRGETMNQARPARIPGTSPSPVSGPVSSPVSGSSTTEGRSRSPSVGGTMVPHISHPASSPAATPRAGALRNRIRVRALRRPASEGEL